MDRTGDRRRFDEADEFEEDLHEFQDTHRRLADRVERFLLQLVILGLVALVLVQTFNMFPTFRRVANVVEALEGIPWNQVTSWTGRETAEQLNVPAAVPAAGNTGDYVLTVVLTSRPSAPEAILLVDGKAVGEFDSPSVSIRVKPGQTLVVDGSRVSQELTFRVVGAPGLSSPSLGSKVTTRGDRQYLGIVKPSP